MKSNHFCTDLELFQRFKKGDNYAFEVIYNRYWQALFKEALRLTKVQDEAKDLVQDIFVSLFQKATSIEIKYSFRAYLYQSLRYKIINAKRDNLIHFNCHNEIYYRCKSENDFPNSLETKELNNHLRIAIAGLPKKCKQVFLLSREEAYSHKAISKQLNISTSTVEKHIVKALKILRGKLSYAAVVL